MASTSSTKDAIKSWADVAASPRSFKNRLIMKVTSETLPRSSSADAFKDRRIIGCFSMDRDRGLHYDRRGLRFYDRDNWQSLLSKPETSLKLSKGYSSDFKSVPDEGFAEEGLKPIRSWMERYLHLCSPPPPTKFVTNRSCLKMILNTPFLNRDKFRHWRIRAEKDGETIYLYRIDDNVTPFKEYPPTYQGYMFEQYLLSDEPGKKPDPIDGPVSQSNGFYCVFSAKVAGMHSILYSAEMDAMVATEDVKKMYQRDRSLGNLELNEACFVELKTAKAGQVHHLYRHNMRTWWIQCSPVGVTTVVCGFKEGEDEDEVREIEEFSTRDLLEKGRSWKPEICNDFLTRFLSAMIELMDGKGCPSRINFELRGGAVYGSC